MKSKTPKTDFVQEAINSDVYSSHAGDIVIACTHARKLERALGKVRAQAELAFAACRSICFATENAVRHGGDYSLNDLLAADKLAREALTPPMTRRPAIKNQQSRIENRTGGAR